MAVVPEVYRVVVVVVVVVSAVCLSSEYQLHRASTLVFLIDPFLAVAWVYQVKAVAFEVYWVVVLVVVACPSF